MSKTVAFFASGYKYSHILLPLKLDIFDFVFWISEPILEENGWYIVDAVTTTTLIQRQHNVICISNFYAYDDKS